MMAVSSWFANPYNNNSSSQGNDREPNNRYQQQQQDQSSRMKQRSSSTVQELVQILYPPKRSSGSSGIGGGTGSNYYSSYYYGGNTSMSSSSLGGGNTRRRFSQLLLEHGEKPIQDWAVVGFSTPDYNSVYDNDHHHHHRKMNHNHNKEINNTNQQQQQQQQLHDQQQSQQKKITWYQSPEYTKKLSINLNNNNSNRTRAGTTASTQSPHPTTGRKYHTQQQQIQLQQQTVVDKDLYPTMHMKNIQGRLYLCTGSLVFEPADPSRGIVRCSFAKMEHGPPSSSSSATVPETENNNTNTTTTNNNRTTTATPGNSNTNLSSSYETILTVQFTCRRHYVMKEDNTIGPYRQVTIPTQFRFIFLHSSPTYFLELCSSLYNKALSKGGNHNSSSAGGGGGGSSTSQQQQPNNNKKSTVSLQPNHPLLVSSSTISTYFDVSNFVDVREQMQTGNLQCSVLSPLQIQAGIMVLTNERIYFQHHQGGSHIGSMVQKWHYRNIVALARRYHGLRDSAIEIYFQGNDNHVNNNDNNNNSSSLTDYCSKRKKKNTSNTNANDTRYYTSILFGFERRHDRELVLRCLQQGGNNGYNIDPNINIDTSNYNNNNNHNTIPCFTDREFVSKVVQEWMKGNISNYDYLLALNSAAGRSFHDLSRYPVFPWIIRDYQSSKLDLTKESTFRDLSKPVGALNEERLAYFKKRLSGMQDMGETFLYGTHYSAPGYVLYYLVRSMPEHMLCLQNGKFDSPDRMFHSIANCYNCVLANHADVKELIPEFFNPSCDYDFLINARGLQLGATQNGERVNDVKLPPWAKSPRDFIKQNRAALESDICTRNLPKWIDLIFGYNSRGSEALDADNVFHQYAYLGPTDLASMQSEEERYTAELQATEFGIVPDQLFIQQHPAKIGMNMNADDVAIIADECISRNIGRASATKDDQNSREAWELLDIPTVSDSNYNSSYNNSNSNNRETGFLNDSRNSSNHNRQTASIHSNNNDEEYDVRPVEIVHAAVIESDAHSPPQNRLREDSAVSWDMKIIERKHIHNDAVSSCALLFGDENSESNLTILATTSLDGGLKVHSLSLESQINNDEEKTATGGVGAFASPLNIFSNIAMINRGQQQSAVIQSVLSDYRTHSARDPLASLVLASDGTGGTVAFVGGHDDVVLAYGIKSACAVASVYSHRDAVTGLDLIQRTPFDADSSIWLEKSTHIMVSGSWDATVKVWSVSLSGGETVSINREPMAELFDADSSVVCVSAMSTAISMAPYNGQDGRIGNSVVIAAGCADGSFCVWNLHSDGVQVLIHREPPPVRKGSGPCSAVKWMSEAGKVYLFAAYSTSGKVASYSLIDGALKRESAISLGVAVLSLTHTSDLLLVGCADGGIRLLSIADGVYLDLKPAILWPAVNNAGSSPGITSISLTYKEEKDDAVKTLNGITGSCRRRCMGCSGAEDGSIVLFELKKV